MQTKVLNFHIHKMLSLNLKFNKNPHKKLSVNIY